ncbi:hypothetical protein CB1_001951020 [Camelus ferus]|nr:hypothetical protein CB1_001951020 [Camelus ferus]
MSAAHPRIVSPPPQAHTALEGLACASWWHSRKWWGTSRADPYTLEHGLGLWNRPGPHGLLMSQRPRLVGPSVAPLAVCVQCCLDHLRDEVTVPVGLCPRETDKPAQRGVISSGENAVKEGEVRTEKSRVGDEPGETCVYLVDSEHPRAGEALSARALRTTRREAQLTLVESAQLSPSAFAVPPRLQEGICPHMGPGDAGCWPSVCLSFGQCWVWLISLQDE